MRLELIMPVWSNAPPFSRRSPAICPPRKMLTFAVWYITNWAGLTPEPNSQRKIAIADF